MIPRHEPECGKNAIAANNQRQSRQQHAARQRGIWRHIPEGMTEEGLGVKKKIKKHSEFFFPPSLQCCHTPPGFRVKLLGAAASPAVGTGQGLAGHTTAGAPGSPGVLHVSVSPSRPWKFTFLCSSETYKAQRGSALGMGTCPCASHVCYRRCWHTGAVLATGSVSPPALHVLPRGCSTARDLAASPFPPGSS